MSASPLVIKRQKAWGQAGHHRAPAPRHQFIRLPEPG